MGNTLASTRNNGSQRSSQKNKQKKQGEEKNGAASFLLKGMLRRKKSTESPSSLSTTRTTTNTLSNSSLQSDEEANTPNRATVGAWCRAWGNHDVKAVMNLTDSDCMFYIPAAELEIMAKDFYDSMNMLVASFPDMKFHWDSIIDLGNNKVEVKNYYGHGHHTGDPFVFGPYQPIKPEGKYVADEPVNLVLMLDPRARKVTRCDVVALGHGIAGPPGFYDKLGGIPI